MFVGLQQRITYGFYNKLLKAYVLIDLKMGNLKPENIGRMNMYINYYVDSVQLLKNS